MAERHINGADLLMYRGSGDTDDAVASITVTVPGTSYETAPTVVFTGGGYTRIATGTAVLSADGVGSVIITDPGEGYTTPPTISFTGGGGADAAGVAVMAEAFDMLGCIDSNTINQAATVNSTSTKCGIIKINTDKDRSVDFSLVLKFSPDTGKVAVETLQSDFDNDTISNWKITTVAGLPGDPIFSWTGFLSTWNYDVSNGQPAKASGTIQIDEDGLSLEIIE